MLSSSQILYQKEYLCKCGFETRSWKFWKMDLLDSTVGSSEPVWQLLQGISRLNFIRPFVIME